MYWRGRGLAWADTNLVALYCHKNDSTQYRGRYIHINNNSFKTIIDTTAFWGHLNNNGAYAMEYNAVTNRFLVLGTDSLNQNILFEVDSTFQNPGDIRVLDGNPIGITMGPSSVLYLSYPERIILPYNLFQAD